APAAAGEKAATMEKKDGSMAGDRTIHVIVARDNFWDLARKYYGDARMWQKIAEANPDSDANGLVIGQELVIPAAR
ncbi:MAG: LysM peptidoglycan-binding domain-containing protein, partial [Notoacmeibacter sp.]|nr:LysM peptidoglycan-binding domain-containing protein [Notoacmeibacter sp.]